ncbi:MAG TPA: ATP-binding protein, partial [Tepidisphaeraceae bacterium]|nr:ATP-binding protein [Tepidisphaeraceae bacterium]
IARSKFLLAMSNVDGHDIVRRSMEVCMPNIEAQGLMFSAELEAKDRQLRADAGRLQQLLSNLLNNAAKFTPTGGRVTLRTRNEDDGRLFVVEVSDTGVGIDPAVLPRIFNAFEQGERSITRTFGGLGLGLTIGKAIAEMHGGSLTASSEGRGRGATMTLRLPVQVAAKPSADPPASQAAPPRRVSVLIVEDHAPTLRLMSRLLRSLGHEVRAAASAERAVELATADCPDLLISDIGMPNQSGWWLMQELRKRCPPTMRAIAVSGYGTDDDIQRSRDAGFTEHIVKPIDVQRLQAAIERAMQTSAA